MRSLSLLSGALLLHQSLALAPEYSDSIFSPYIAEKYDRVGAAYKTASYPHITAANGSWIWTHADWWTSGFLPGSFYLLEERKRLCPKDKALNSVDWLTYGRRWSDGLISLQAGNGQGHDQGFLALPYLDELKINPTNASAITGVKNFATLLANRYSSIVGCTRSWNSAAPEFQVIMDNMMNLELLFTAANLTGNRTLIDMAISHANKTIDNHIRPDGSSYHVVAYNENTGAHLDEAKLGVYMVFNLTSQPQYLDTARRMAKVFITRLPSNGIPPYDYDAPDPTDRLTPLLPRSLLKGYSFYPRLKPTKRNRRSYYKEQGVKLLTNNFKFAFKPTWDSILSNGTSNVPQNNKNTGLVYGTITLSGRKHYVKARSSFLLTSMVMIDLTCK
ncbi:glycoside hydrolase family 88 protein [Rhizoctonia solani]|uniref:Glycoside hydrolase family 88 protein n=1 Tax=Rhizoctonia solani TaxID=456999 RepID=A0A8H8T0R2_9AGAM|nr:glycoside hydrolase family 88 protein [Rhizoctonia solani]QRW24609.1 glycoside hydrolase family 88 protein [Rhizoctonia solani]